MRAIPSIRQSPPARGPFRPEGETWWLALLLLAATTACGTSKVVNPDASGPKGEKHLVDFYCAPQDDCSKLAKEVCEGPYETVTATGKSFGNELLVRCTERVTRKVGKNVLGPHGEMASEFVCIETLGECMDAFRRECKGDFNILASNNGAWLIECFSPPGFVPPQPPAPPPSPPDKPFSRDGGVSLPSP
jgi:hypothetical protein